MLYDVVYAFDIFGTAVFAISGVIAAGKQRMDPFGVLVLATVTAIGGGTIRDVVIGADKVFWVHDSTYLIVIFLTALVTMLAMLRTHRFSLSSLPVLDAFGLAVFTLIGTEKALAHGTSEVVAIVMGVVTGVAGGMVRDLLAGNVPMVLKKDIYATASFLGAVLYIASLSLGVDSLFAMVLCMTAVLVLRLYAIHRHLSLPTFVVEEDVTK